MRKTTEVLFLLLTAACASQPAQAPPAPPPGNQVPPVPRPRLTDADLDTIGEIIRLEDRRELDAARFSSWLRAGHEEVRRRAAIGAGRIGDRQATPLLLNALNDPVAAVRTDVAFALGELNDTSAMVVEALAQRVRQPGEEGAEAIAALGRLASPSAYATIESVLTNAAGSARAKQEALLAIVRFPRKPHTLGLMVPFMAATDVETRWRAVYVLTRGNADPRAVPQLIKLLSDPDPLVRALAARGLRSATADSANARAEAMSALRSALADPHPHVRINAVGALGGYRWTDNILAITALLRDVDGNVALAAAQALGVNGGGITALAEIAQGIAGEHIGLRTAALTALTRTPEGRPVAQQIAREWLRTPASQQLTTQWLTDPARLQRIFGLGLLVAGNATGNASENAALIREAVNDADPLVASAALNAVVDLDTVSPPYALFIEKLAHRDAEVRAAAIGGLARRNSPSDLELFLRAYDRGQQDASASASYAAVDALGALARGGLPVERSFFLQFRKPSDPLLHQRIVQRIGAGDWGPVPPVNTGRPTDFYRAVARRFFHSDSTSRPRVRIRTAPGEFVLGLDARAAPLTVLNFLTLTERGHFNGGRWHRVVPNFVLQDGAGRGDGSGARVPPIRDEINRLRYTRGAVGMALSGPDTGTSQFFIGHAPQPHLDGGYTVFGYVVAGMDIADRVVQDDPIIAFEIIR